MEAILHFFHIFELSVVWKSEKLEKIILKFSNFSIFPTIVSNYMEAISWNFYFRRTFQNRKWSHINGILVRNQSNGFVEHSTKFWWSIFWTITWNVWPSDISVGTSWILCIQGNFSSIFSNTFPNFCSKKVLNQPIFTTADIISSKI